MYNYVERGGELMSIPRGTTPIFELTFKEEELDLTKANHVYVTFRCKGYKLTKTGDDLTVYPKRIDVHLGQSETLNFINEIEIQANWTFDGDGHADDRCASNVVKYPIDKQLEKGVLA